jgi:hypothetical protein
MLKMIGLRITWRLGAFPRFVNRCTTRPAVAIVERGVAFLNNINFLSSAIGRVLFALTLPWAASVHRAALSFSPVEKQGRAAAVRQMALARAAHPPAPPVPPHRVLHRAMHHG